ncbi:MAG TPA: response regulator [Gemmatimonadales bacterium]|nr:response regulator [Gemmatimonadales bacterium]
MTDDVKPLWSGATTAIHDSVAQRVAVVRYRLRAAAHRIAADCERMVDGLDRPERRLWRDVVDAALVAGRQLLALLARSEPGADLSDSSEYFVQLHERIREPQRRIVDAMSTLLGFVPTGPEEELLMEDARAVREAAVGLWALDDSVPSVAAAGDREPRVGATPPGAEHPRPRLLVVDDEPDARRALSRLLERLGYDVALAEDGRAALEIAERQPLDLILTDLRMPVLDGFELLARLKGAESTRDIPVIVVSGVDDLQSVVRCIEQGAEDHVTKPFEAVLLQARIRASLERKRMRDLELAYLRRVAQVTAAAEAVERDAYEPGALDAVGSRDDELGRLARVFDRMVSGMRSRDERLQRRLGHLRREVQQADAWAGDGPALAPDANPFAPGRLVAGRYEILGGLGKGGMGAVYRASDRKSEEEIALRVVRRDLLAGAPDVVEQLASEIGIARRIVHRNVGRVHDIGAWEGACFVTMEYVRGITLEELLDTRGALTVETTLAIGAQLAEGLAAAHEQRIIHRDVRPANLTVTQEGRLKVMDLGLAPLAERSRQRALEGLATGTPGYLAPEVHLGGAVDARSDLFSAGVVLYECLTGRPPFDAGSPTAVADRMREGRAEPIRTRAPHVPPVLAAVIEQLMRREPQERIGTARELAERLARIGQGPR